MNLLEGSLVVIVGTLDKRVREKQQNGLVIGTFLGKISDKRVVVLLQDSDIFVGQEYEIIKYEEQE